MPIAEILIAALVGAIVLMGLHWRTCVKLVLVALVVEGAVRKWLVPSAADFVYFGKDAIVIVAYLKYMWRPPHRSAFDRRTRGIATSAMLIGVFLLLQTCNPNLGSPIVGFVGARNYLLYIPMMFMVGDLFDHQAELDRFLRRYLLLSLPIFALAIVQYWSPPDAAINQYVKTEAQVYMGFVGEHVRVTGTFSYIAGYASYLLVVITLVIPLLLIRHHIQWHWALRAVLASSIAGIVLTGSRGPAIGIALFFSLYVVLNKTARQLRLYNRFIGPAIMCGLVTVTWFGSALENYMERVRSNSDLTDRLVSCFLAPIQYIEEAGLFGFGVGATYQAAIRIRSLFNLPEGTFIPVYYESEPERIMLELGPIGFTAWYGFRLFLMLGLWRTYRSLSRPLLRELALAAFLLHVVALPNQVVYQITFLVYYWFTAGFMFLLPHIERRHDAMLLEREMLEQAALLQEGRHNDKPLISRVTTEPLG